MNKSSASYMDFNLILCMGNYHFDIFIAVSTGLASIMPQAIINSTYVILLLSEYSNNDAISHNVCEGCHFKSIGMWTLIRKPWNILYYDEHGVYYCYMRYDIVHTLICWRM